MSKFIGKIKLGPNDTAHNEIEIELQSPETDLMFDDVEFGLYNEMEKHFPEEYYPKAEISEIFILETDSDGNENRYPVLSDEEFESKKDLYKNYSKILCLPYAVYSLTPEAKLHVCLSRYGLLDEDVFDLTMMKKLYAELKEIFKNDK